MASEAQATPINRAGWSLRDWCDSVGFSIPKFYTLPEAARPRLVKVGTRVIIREAPADYLDRVAAAGGLPSRKRKAA
jgi:hypothetical protein